MNEDTPATRTAARISQTHSSHNTALELTDDSEESASLLIADVICYYRMRLK